LSAIPLNFEERTGHLPQLLRDVIVRLRLEDETKAEVSTAAHHGDLRAQQGYTLAMAVEGSRLLRVSIFTTLHKNQGRLDFDVLLPDVMTIADEVRAGPQRRRAARSIFRFRVRSRGTPLWWTAVILRFMASDVAKASEAAEAAEALHTALVLGLDCFASA
jgi:hypothetical protein